MAGTLFQVEYKKLNTFIYDFMKSIDRGWIFIRTNASPALGERIDFTFSVESLSSPLKFTGEVVYLGADENGSDGIGIKIVRGMSNADSVKKELISIVETKYGDYVSAEFKRLINVL